MKVINRKSKEVLENNNRSEQQLFVTVRKHYIHFTAPSSVFCGISSGLFIQFINEGDEWFFFTDDNVDGFKIFEVANKKGNRPNHRIHSIGLVNMILKSTGFKIGKRFSIEKTENQHDRSPIFKLSLKNVSTIGR